MRILGCEVTGITEEGVEVGSPKWVFDFTG